ncbi:MAG: hypothetical protein AAB680_02095 [Pseudomonadota bacterium]
MAETAGDLINQIVQTERGLDMFSFFRKKEFDPEFLKELFEGATELPDEVYLAAIENSKTKHEKQLGLVAEFHRSFLNGGFAGAFSYYYSDTRKIVSSYRKMKLEKFADIIAKAEMLMFTANLLGNLPYEDISELMVELDNEYTALCYENEDKDSVEVSLCEAIILSPNDYYNILNSALEG